MRTADLREQSGQCQVIREVERGRVLIHGSRVLIPRETRLRLIGRQGEEALSVTSYADCHKYSSKSALRFDAVDTAASASPNSSSPPHPSPIPVGLHVVSRGVTS